MLDDQVLLTIGPTSLGDNGSVMRRHVQRVGKAWSLGGVLANHLEIVNVKDHQDLLNVTLNIVHSLGHEIAGIVHTRPKRLVLLNVRVFVCNSLKLKYDQLKPPKSLNPYYIKENKLKKLTNFYWHKQMI